MDIFLISFHNNLDHAIFCHVLQKTLQSHFSISYHVFFYYTNYFLGTILVTFCTICYPLF